MNGGVMDRDEIRKACEAATPGPWEEGDHWVFVMPEVTSASLRDVLKVPAGGNGNANAAFIAGAREWVPALLDENEKLREALRYFARPLHQCGYPTCIHARVRALLAEGE